MANIAVKPQRRIQTPRRFRRRNMVGWTFVGPFLAVFLFALVLPIGYAIYLSLFRQHLLGGNQFVWFSNYSEALSDPSFWSAVRRVAEFLIIQVPIMLALAMLSALAIDSARLKWSPLYRITLFLPYAVPSVVAAFMWGFMYGKQFGLINNLDSFFGISLPDPLSPGWILPSIANINTWEFVGYNMLIFYSALLAIPGELYEAARIDGAGELRIARSIKAPALRPALLITVIFSVIGSFQLFNEPNILHSLAPNSIGTNFTPNMYAYNLAFGGQQYNYAAAIAIVMGIITMLVAYFVQLANSRSQS